MNFNELFTIYLDFRIFLHNYFLMFYTNYDLSSTTAGVLNIKQCGSQQVRNGGMLLSKCFQFLEYTEVYVFSPDNNTILSSDNFVQDRPSLGVAQQKRWFVLKACILWFSQEMSSVCYLNRVIVYCLLRRILSTLSIDPVLNTHVFTEPLWRCTKK